MYVRELHLRHVKLFRDTKVSFLRGAEPRMWTVLVGENGLGKTTILRAVALAACGSVLANGFASGDELRDLRAPNEEAVIDATFGFGSLRHRIREYPGLGSRKKSPPLLSSRLTFLPQHQYATCESGYDGFVTPSPLDEVRSRELRSWFVAGYGIERKLPPPSVGITLDRPAYRRLAPLFDREPIVGTGFADLFETDDRRREYAQILKKVFLGTRDKSPLLPNVTRLELRGRGGPRRPQT